MIEILVWVVLAYLIAAIPVGLVIGRLRGVDLREVGSGNIGATNAVRALGRQWGLIVFALDVGKAAVPVALALARFGGTARGDEVIAVIALAAMLGHVFPIYLGFKGGKGVACAFGVFLILAPASALVAFLLYLQTLALTRISAVGSLTATTAMVGVAWLDPDVPIAWKWLCTSLAGLVWWRHRENLPGLLKRSRGTGDSAD